VLRVDVENGEAGGFAGADSDQRAHVATPQRLHGLRILARVVERVRRARLLVVGAGKDRQPGAGKLEGGFKRLRATPLH
jgi:hypothetical protein